MKNLFVLLMTLALIGSASAWGLADAENPYTFSTDGNLTDMAPDVWGTWGGDAGSAGSVVVSGGVCTFTSNSYELAFSHDNALADIGNPVPGVDDVEVHFDVISISPGAQGIVKIEMHSAGNSFPNPDNGAGAVRIDAWDPTPLTVGHVSFSTADLGGPIDAATVAITPVVGISAQGVTDAQLVIDNFWVGKAGTYLTTKATNPNPKKGALASSVLTTALTWTNPEPNSLGDTITSDVYFLDAGLAPLAQDPNLGPDITDPGVIQLANDTTAETVSVPALTDDHYYYWAVHCTDSGTGVTTQGDTWYFIAGDAPPVANAGSDQYMWLSQDDSTLDPTVPQDENVRYFQVVGTYSDDGKSAIVDANFVNEGWGWDPDGADNILGNADDQRGIELVSETWDQTPNTVHTSGTVTAVYRTHYTEGDPANSTDIPGWWTIRLQVTDAAGTGTDVALHRIDIDCGTASANDPADFYSEHYDTNNDCVVNVADFAAFTLKWLDQSVKYE